MKKAKRIITSLLAAVFAAVCVSFTAVAEEVKDIELSTSRAVTTNGAWGQSISYGTSDINPAYFTKDTTIRVEYELEGEAALPNQYQVELILQNYVADPAIWAQVIPVEYDDTYAVFDYDGMVLAYGSDDLSDVNNILFGDRGIQMKVTKVTVTNVAVPEVTTTTTAAAETEAAAESAAAVTTASSSNSGGLNTTILIVIVVAVVVVAAAIVTVVVIKGNKKRFY